MMKYGCTIVARKDLLRDNGLFDETLRFTHDYDLWVRLMPNDVHFYYFKYSLIQYRWHDAMGTMKYKLEIEPEIAMIYSRYRQLLNDYARRYEG